MRTRVDLILVLWSKGNRNPMELLEKNRLQRCGSHHIFNKVCLF